MVRKTKADAERTYHALLDAATVLFIRQGVAQTTLGAIASEAGMTRGAVYWHFENKDAVIEALWERNADRLQQALADMLGQVAPPHPARQFRAALKEVLRTVVREPEVGQAIRIVIHNVEFTDEQTPLQRFLDGKKTEIRAALERAAVALAAHGALRPDLTPALAADGLLSYLHGLIHHHLSPGRGRIDLAKNGDALLDLMLDALLVE